MVVPDLSARYLKRKSSKSYQITVAGMLFGDGYLLSPLSHRCTYIDCQATTGLCTRLAGSTIATCADTLK